MSDKLKKNLQDYKDSNGLLTNIKLLVSEHCKDLADIDDSELSDRLGLKMNEVFTNLKEFELISVKNLKSAMEGLNQSLIAKQEAELFTLLGRYDELIKAIKNKREEIKNRLKISFETAEWITNANEFEGKSEILDLLNNAIIRESRMLSILSESAQQAFLTTVEQGQDVGDTVAQISKNMTYVSIIGGEFSKERILEISKTIVMAACEVANEGHIFAKELIDGAVSGAKDGILKSLERIKENSKFAPDEVKLNSELNNLKNIDLDFIQMLKELDDSIGGIAKNEISALLLTELDTKFAKLKRMGEQASEQILERLDELKLNSNLTSFMNTANLKLEEFKTELNERSKKLKDSFESSEKFEEIKQNLAEFENKANTKFEELRQIDIKNEAKKIGDRVYKAAKDFMANLKKTDA
ncbi:hypothetical protein KDD93_08620 [Campylobacter sp. faydin G-24]|uniref:Uncharacterized protein n=1 Tax=Campylobacter anatolicus TaxID=2829105 RepID=A0ABS5HK21_9BACT|nr:hypothetical protein [Campylobacter anatolicus]MBR8461265.1 hypothetical protein [Campylobacter anatolicus]MBR8464620.1 hypothetical protein [Campylobacter anatolicus]MBR8466443.1 hypothetical protein [Campylobacter anatolicus]